MVALNASVLEYSFIREQKQIVFFLLHGHQCEYLFYYGVSINPAPFLDDRTRTSAMIRHVIAKKNY